MMRDSLQGSSTELPIPIVTVEEDPRPEDKTNKSYGVRARAEAISDKGRIYILSGSYRRNKRGTVDTSEISIRSQDQSIEEGKIYLLDEETLGNDDETIGSSIQEAVIRGCELIQSGVDPTDEDVFKQGLTGEEPIDTGKVFEEFKSEIDERVRRDKKRGKSSI